MQFADTIVALITGAPPAPVAWVRLSGPDSFAIARQVLPSFAARPNYAEFGKYIFGEEGYAIAFEEGRSYTGEESVELSIHGALASVRALVDACLAAGARLAEPGEFTRRAFMNGRIDLSEAEAVRDTIDAATERQLRSANAQRSGALRAEIEAIEGLVIDVLAAVEASVDFSEETGPFDVPSALSKLGLAQVRTEKLLSTANTGRIVREGARIALLGRPNVGKSSLFNALLGASRAIVTAVPGTTRDTLEEGLILGGLRAVLTDTAGLRDAQDEVEKIGVGLSKEAGENADLIWFLIDAAEGPSSEDEEFLQAMQRPVLKIANKTDLAPAPQGWLGVSATTGVGLPELIAASEAAFAPVTETLTISSRHTGALLEAKESLEAAIEGLGHDSPSDLITVHLQTSLHALGELTGKTASVDILDQVFSRFCVGK
ncbi:MAG: tRNA uridine-5-carboxymethylaminomethyl(34) synthesis GTPase MnmE [Armatimonadetes bacterium]|nr:tRNA uridine-5-carboxymethylaminomethyl(34) synthesis GTPase MnmE [Armatimonadota bacterium]